MYVTRDIECMYIYILYFLSLCVEQCPFVVFYTDYLSNQG